MEIPDKIDDLMKVEGLSRKDKMALKMLKKFGGKRFETYITALNTEIMAFKKEHGRDPNEKELKDIASKVSWRMV